MANSKVVSLHVRPFQASHLCFEVDGILEQLNTQLGDPIVAGGHGLGLFVFNFASFYGVLRSALTVDGDLSRLLFDSLQIQAATKTSTLASLRAETGKAALDRAINARQNAYFAKYGNADQIIFRMNAFYSSDVEGSKLERLATLSRISEDQWNQLQAAYKQDKRMGVIRNTSSRLASDTTSYGYSAASGETAQLGASALVSEGQGTLPQPPTPLTPPSWPPPAPSPPLAVGVSEWKGIGFPSNQEMTQQQSTSYQVVSSEDAAHQDQTIINTDYGYRVPFKEGEAQYQRAQISLIDEQFAQFMRDQNLPHLAQVFQNELNSIDGDVFRLQIAFLNTILMSPISGVVTGVYKNPGDAVKAGETVIRVENNAVLLLVATVVHRGPITIGSNVAVRTHLFDSESVRKLSIGIAQLSQHQPDGCQPDECEGVTGPVLEILGQPTTAVKPGEGALNHPASGQNLKALRRIRTFDYFNSQLRQQLGQFRAEFRTLVTGVGE